MHPRTHLGKKRYYVLQCWIEVKQYNLFGITWFAVTTQKNATGSLRRWQRMFQQHALCDEKGVSDGFILGRFLRKSQPLFPDMSNVQHSKLQCFHQLITVFDKVKEERL